MEFPTKDKFAKDVAEKALDEFIYEGKTIREWIEIIVKQQPCEDAISRVDAIRIASINSMPVDECIRRIKELPPVKPQNKSGEWIGEESLDGSIRYMCSNCKEYEYVDYYDFCPNCGADMRESEDKE